MKTKDKKAIKNGSPKQEVKDIKKQKHEIPVGLRSLFIDELKDIYCAEKALSKAMPEIINNATADELVEALTVHMEVTKKHITRLEKVFSSIGEKAEVKNCEAMTGLIRDAEVIMGETEKGMVRDAGIIAAAQKMEHYEIASYGTLCAFAKTLGEETAAALFLETLNEEKEADEKLSEIAESFINAEAAGIDQDMEDEGDIDSSGIITKYKRK